MDELQQSELQKNWYEKIRSYYFSNKNNSLKVVAFALAFIVAIFIAFESSPASSFPVGSVLTISPGESLQEISMNLKNDNIIRSVFIFRSTAILLGGEKKIIAGDYLLDKKESSTDLAYRLIKGDFHLEQLKITIPEGWNSAEITDYLSTKILKFNKTEFLKLAKANEGYLFPDTYFVRPTASSSEIIKMMRGNFDQKISQTSEIKKSDKLLSEIIIMASILEGEALPKDRAIVSGILWKRIAMGMPLQVDSTFIYINGKGTFDLTLDDLKIDSPYNTYKYKGLPPGPIGNPGIDSIIAAASPVKSPYLYFLTSRDGTIHYAKTFEEHKKNKELYLR